MIESKWLGCNHPKPMLEFLRGKASDRKLRLFGCACCRRFWPLFKRVPLGRRAIEVVERNIERGIKQPERGLVLQVKQSSARSFAILATASLCGWLQKAHGMAEAVSANAALVFAKAAESSGHFMEALAGEQRCQAALLREIFGNPYRPVSNDPFWLSWHDGLLVSMARRMYDSRDFTDMPVLADALEEAGCQDQDILSHCRAGGEHVRGCWVIDSLRLTHGPMQ